MQLTDETRLAVLEEKSRGLELRVEDLKESVGIIEQKLDTKLSRIEQKIDDLNSARAQHAGVMRVTEWFWRVAGPVMAALGGAWFTRHGM